MGARLGPARFHVGTQGWNYPAWVGPFYPRAARPGDFLSLYTRIFDTVEVDSTFYAIPSAASVENWVRRTPATFRFALKFPREATHEAELAARATKDVLERFIERVRPLGPRLGPILVQLPPGFGPSKRDRLDAFLDRLPRDLRFAVEFRDPAWLETNVLESFAARGIAPTFTDAPFLPLDAVLALARGTGAEHTAGVDFVYVRWLGDHDAVTDFARVVFDRRQELTRWADALPPLLARGIDVYGYFNNHYQGHSPASARAFLQLIGQEPRDPSELEPQGELF